MTQSSFYNAPSRNFAAVVPSNTVNQPESRGVVCLTAGSLVATNANGDDVTFPLTAGQVLRITPTKVKTTSTGTYALLR